MGFGWSELSVGYFQQISAATNAAGDAIVFGVLGVGSSMPNSLWEYNGSWQVLSPAGTILSISAVTDAAGNDDVYAITADHQLWEHTPAGWAILSDGSFTQVSAGHNSAGQAVVYGVLTNHSLWEDNPAFGGWQMLSPAGPILSVSAGGRDEVFAITADTHLWEHAATGWSELSAGSFAALSARQTPTGQDEVFATLTDSSFWVYNTGLPGDHWMNLLSGGVASSSSA